MNKAFKIASNPKYDGYQRGLAGMVYKFFNIKIGERGKRRVMQRGVNTTNKISGKGGLTRRENISNKKEPNYQLANELHATIIKTFTKRKVYSSYVDHIWGLDLADMQKLSNKNNSVKYLLCVIDIYSKYAWVKGLTDKKGISVGNAFKEIIDKYGRKPDKIWVDNGKEFYNIFFEKFSNDNNIEMYLIYNEGKLLVAERVIGTLKTNIYKYVTAINDNVYYDHLDKIVEKYNNTVNRSIKMKPINVKNSDNKTYVVTPNKQSAKFKINDLLRISQFKNVFAKGYSPNWSKEIFKISSVKNVIHGHMKLVI